MKAPLATLIATFTTALAATTPELQSPGAAHTCIPDGIAAEVEAALRTHTLDRWFPACVDQARGGFNQNFSEDWKPVESNTRFTVFQARMTWLSSQVALRRKDLAPTFLPYARHGIAFLRDKAWDHEHGGFFSEVDLDGKPPVRYAAEKHLYANAFGLYAAAAAYRATGDADALDLAKRAFRWIDEHAYDTREGGYFEVVTREGTPMLEPTVVNGRKKLFSMIGAAYGYKSTNLHIHLLEAFTELLPAWDDPVLRARTKEILELTRDRIAVPPGCLNAIFTRDWRPVPDTDSFGHDVETAYLMLEAAEALGDTNPATLQVARSLVDHALDYGWDSENGGLYEAGFAFKPPVDTRKTWWVQAESLNALLLMDRHFGSGTDRYREMFLRQWAFIRDKQIDSANGGWHDTLEPDGTPLPGKNKGHFWKAGYHEGCALLNVSDALRSTPPTNAPSAAQ